MEKIHKAGGIVLSKYGQVAVVSQRVHTGISWSFPKGDIEKGEEAFKAACREIQEETGLRQLRLIKELGAYERHTHTPKSPAEKGKPKHITMFMFCTDQDDLKPTDPTNPEARWFFRNVVPKVLSHPLDASFFLRAMRDYF